MGRPVLQVKGYTPEQIKALIGNNKSWMLGIRLHAVYQVSLGHPSREVAEWYQTSFKQITNWVHRFEQHGVGGLKDQPGRGRNSRLSAEQMQALSHLVTDESPLKHGYNTDTWTGPLLIDWIRTHFGISYKKAQIYNILKKLGLSWQKAKARYPPGRPCQSGAVQAGLKKNS